MHKVMYLGDGYIGFADFILFMFESAFSSRLSKMRLMLAVLGLPDFSRVLRAIEGTFEVLTERPRVLVSLTVFEFPSLKASEGRVLKASYAAAATPPLKWLSCTVECEALRLECEDLRVGLRDETVGASKLTWSIWE